MGKCRGSMSIHGVSDVIFCRCVNCDNSVSSSAAALSERKNVVEIVVDVVGKHFSRYLFNIFNAVSATELSQAKCEEEAQNL